MVQSYDKYLAPMKEHKKTTGRGVQTGPSPGSFQAHQRTLQPTAGPPPHTQRVQVSQGREKTECRMHCKGHPIWASPSITLRES